MVQTTSESSLSTPRPAPPGWRRWRWAAGGAALIALVLVIGIAWYLRASQAQLIGGALINDRPPAPDFKLTDQLGKPVQLGQFRGKPVALTFLYTNCPDVCPLIASNLHATYKLLGDQAADVAMVAVTVDPEHDTVDQVRQFSDSRGLTDEWSFLTGPADQLEPVWKAYGILAQPVDAQGKPISPVAQRDAQGLIPQPQDIEHSAPIFLVDKAGALRAMLPVDFTPATLATDLRILRSEH